MSPKLRICPESVRTLAELLRETDLSEIEYQVDSLRIRVVRSVQQTVIPVQNAPIPVDPQHVAPPPNPTSPADNIENHPGLISAQMVGTVYLSPGAGAEPFVKIGDKIEVGQTLFIIEAMKVMNMIKSPVSGTLKNIFVKDAQPVEYGEHIMIVE